MSPRTEYLVALVTANPGMIAVAFLSLALCASVFIGALFLKHRSQHEYAACLPLDEQTSTAQKGDYLS
jgi:hypothetical protein